MLWEPTGGAPITARGGERKRQGMCPSLRGRDRLHFIRGGIESTEERRLPTGERAAYSRVSVDTRPAGNTRLSVTRASGVDEGEESR